MDEEKADMCSLAPSTLEKAIEVLRGLTGPGYEFVDMKFKQDAGEITATISFKKGEV